MKKFFGEFKTFITRGNVLDMAVGVIVGGAFTAIVNGVSNFVLKPLINSFLALLLGKDALSEIFTFLKTAYMVDEATGEKVRDLAIRAYKALGCRGLSRVDFFVKNDDTIIFNEINTLPGFTPISMYPKLFMQTGMTYSEVIDNLLKLAMES